MHQNKLLPLWPLNITVKALISAFVMLLKAGVALPISEGKRLYLFMPLSTTNRGNRYQLVEIAVVQGQT